MPQILLYTILLVDQMKPLHVTFSNLRRLLVVGCVVVSACTTTSQSEWKSHHIGRVESVRVVSTIPSSSGRYAGLYAFGAFGGVAAAALQDRSSKISRYSVRTGDSQVVEVEWPEQLEIGQCVAVMGERDDPGGLSYPYPMGKVISSSDCN